MRVNSLLIAAFLLACPGIALGSDMSVFGLRLGEKFSMSECPRQMLGKTVAYGFPGTEPCFERPLGKTGERGPIINDTVLVKFPLSQIPSLVAGLGISVLIIDGNLEGVGFNTRGVDNADWALKRLKEKYGEPTAVVPRTVQNRMGAAFEAFTASWELPGLYVHFESVSTSLDSGLVNIDTKLGREHRDEALRELLKDKRPL